MFAWSWAERDIWVKSNPELYLVGSPHVVNANTHVLCAISRPKANTVHWLTAAGKQARKYYLLKRKSYLIIAQIYFCMLDGRPSVLRKRKKPDRTSENLSIVRGTMSENVFIIYFETLLINISFSTCKRPILRNTNFCLFTF